MVEYALNLDAVFSSLADPTRRDILKRVSKKQLSIGEVAQNYDLTFAAISKHLQVLENAKLITKRRQGKRHYVSVSPAAFKSASDYLQYYESLWNDRFDALETLLNKED